MSEERPFGNLYTAADYVFFRDRNLDMDRSRTPAEEIITEAHIKGIFERISEAEQELYAELIRKITGRGIEVKHSRRSDSDKLFVLTADPITLSVVQHERRTKIIFPPDPDMRYDPFYFYGLFFTDLPTSIYGTGKNSPSPAHIRNSTEITISPVSKKTRKFDLKDNASIEEFEEAMENPEEISSVLLQCSGEGVSYTLILPNPKNSGKYAQFSFPSACSLRSETVNLLLKIHRDGGKLNDRNRSYAEALADSINYIREDLRVR